MLFMLHLLGNLLKFSLILTFVRLFSTALNWEFGVSRNYLRFLELIFHLGQERIERAQSGVKLALSSHQDDVTASSENNDKTKEEADKLRRRKVGVCFAPTQEAGEKLIRRNDDPDDATDCEGQQVIEEARGRLKLDVNDSRKDDPSIDNKKDVNNRKQKLRRVSTPDGPPVFLLDDDYDEGDDGGNDCCAIEEQLHEFQLTDACRLIVRGLSAVIDDQVTKRFTPEELKTWNLLTRNDAKNYHFMSRSLGLFWLFGVVVRYAILLPMRILFTLAGFMWLVSTTAIIGLLPRKWRDKPYRLMCLMSFRMLSCGLTSRLTFHNKQYKAQKGDICVANHTSPLDVVLLACDNCYALVGQRHGGLLGTLESALSRATNHVWFDRAEMRDRQLVTQRLREHASSKDNLPVLIFPEGTCINNSAVMMFRKGSFECTDRVCPVAIKYDSRFGDPFWNSSKQTYVQYLLLMMSSWAIKCEVWYLPPMERREGELSAEFANRVKAEIARQGGLVDLAWDGQLKRSAPKELWKHQQQEDFARRLKLE